MRQAAAKITQAGQGKFYGITWGLTNLGSWDMGLIISLAAAGGVTAQWGWDAIGAAFDFRTGMYKYASPEFVNALKVWTGMRQDGSVLPGDVSMDDEQAKRLFATDKAGLIFGGPWNVSNHYAYNPKADFDVVLSPTSNDGVPGGREEHNLRP